MHSLRRVQRLTKKWGADVDILSAQVGGVHNTGQWHQLIYAKTNLMAGT